MCSLQISAGKTKHQISKQSGSKNFILDDCQNNPCHLPRVASPVVKKTSIYTLTKNNPIWPIYCISKFDCWVDIYMEWPYSMIDTMITISVLIRLAAYCTLLEQKRKQPLLLFKNWRYFGGSISEISPVFEKYLRDVIGKKLAMSQR